GCRYHRRLGDDPDLHCLREPFEPGCAAMIEFVGGMYNYWISMVLMMIGFYILIAQGNLLKKLIGLNLFQTSVFIFYISIATVEGGAAPILSPDESVYANPLPHVLILTAIVVGIAT